MKDTTKEKQSAQELFDSLKNDPQAVILWAEREIKAYQELIKLLKMPIAKKEKGV